MTVDELILRLSGLPGAAKVYIGAVTGDFRDRDEAFDVARVATINGYSKDLDGVYLLYD